MPLNRTLDKLARIYYDPSHPAGFSTVGKLQLATRKKIPRKTISDWLIGQDSYTRHKPRRLHFRRNCYLITNIDDLWEADLIIMPEEYAAHNNGVKYALCKLKKKKMFHHITKL